MTTLVTIATTAALAITGAGAAVAAWASQLAASASLAATVIGAASQAMLANLCSRTMNAIIETGKISAKPLKATASSDAMKSLLKTGIRAGVTTGLGIAAPSAPSSVQEAFALIGAALRKGYFGAKLFLKFIES